MKKLLTGLSIALLATVALAAPSHMPKPARATDSFITQEADGNLGYLVRRHVALAIDAAKRNDLDKANSELQTAVAGVPYLTDALVMLADIRMRHNDAAGAKAYLEEALRFNPQHRGANQRLRAMK